MRERTLKQALPYMGISMEGFSLLAAEARQTINSGLAVVPESLVNVVGLAEHIRQEWEREHGTDACWYNLTTSQKTPNESIDNPYVQGTFWAAP